MPHIPLEIIDAIIDQISGLHNSSNTWKTCALVSKSFRPHSQRLLYRSILINTGHPSRVLRLHAILEDSPHLAAHVRDLSLLNEPRGLALIFDTLVDTLARFTRVTNCIWTEPARPPESLRTRLYQFFRSSSLVDVVIYAHPVLVGFLASCEQLKSLAVNAQSDYPNSPGAVSISTARSTPASGLLELTIHQSLIVEFVHALTSRSSRLRVSHLRRLMFIRSFAGQNLEAKSKAFQQVLDICAESLEELTVRGASIDANHYDLTRLTRLTQLHHSIPPLVGVELELWLETFLRTSLPTPNSLRVVTLRFLGSSFHMEWNICDATLSKAKHISQAHISFVLPDTFPNYTTRMQDVFTAPELAKEYIPNLMERGDVSIAIDRGPGINPTIISFSKGGSRDVDEESHFTW